MQDGKFKEFTMNIIENRSGIKNETQEHGVMYGCAKAHDRYLPIIEKLMGALEDANEGLKQTFYQQIRNEIFETLSWAKKQLGVEK